MVPKTRCPRCGDLAVSNFGKMLLYSDTSGACRSCGKRIGVAHVGAACFVSFMIAVALGSLLPTTIGKILVTWLIGIVLVPIVQLYLLPLEAR
jgi:uncharacterized protein (DUF983 family)